MKRQKRGNHHAERDSNSISLQKVSPPKFENTIEAQVQDGDTLQALALRFNCTVADIKRLNKIDKDNEIYARKVVKIPVTAHSILLETQPTVHKSGSNSPKHQEYGDSNITKNPLASNILSEKLLVASVNAAGDTINNIILHSKITSSAYSDHPREDKIRSDASDSEPLLNGTLDELMPQPRPIPGPSAWPCDWSGSDCDMSWVCLLIVILALCFAIPLIYVLYIAENPKRVHHSSL